MDRLTLDEFLPRYTALNFMFPELHEPQFRNNRAAVTDDAAMKIGDLFRALVKRGETRERAQRFTLQCVVAMFSEDTGLLPRGLFTELVSECADGGSSYDLLGALFAQMNRSERARGGRFKSVRYFNGGIFSQVDPIELTNDESSALREACAEDWSRINPAIFGTLFQESMESADRHRKGAHYTPEAEIMRVILPTIVQPWQSRIQGAGSVKELLQLRSELTSVRVLDPACGSGNFLYVAYREMKRLELSIIERVHDEYKETSRLKMGAATTIQTKQFFGLDNDPFAVELAKVTLVLAKKLAFDEAQHALEDSRVGLDFDAPLPLENLDENVQCNDAMFCRWPSADIIIGNPPFQSKNKASTELSPEYMRRVRARYPGVPGRADYCVYWFRRAHDELPDGGRIGLVGTNTIRQNFSREGGLDHVVQNGGTIVDAVSTQVWPGRAVVHVSIVNWVKAQVTGKKRLSVQEGDQIDSPWREVLLDRIPASLREVDVTAARTLKANAESDLCSQGLTHGHEGFLLKRMEAEALTRGEAARAVIHPYLTGDELISGIAPDKWRYVIDLSDRADLISARSSGRAFEWVRERVMNDIVSAAEGEYEKTKKRTGPRQSHAKRWWRLWRGRPELVRRLAGMKRYIACSRVTKRPIFDFVSSIVRPSDVVVAFPLDDDYSFGILQSQLHWLWFNERCSTFKGDPRYTNTTVFDSFAWPQAATAAAVRRVAAAAVMLRRLRRTLLSEHRMNLRELYISLEDPGAHPLKDAQAALDEAVHDAYGMGKREDPVRFIFNLNAHVASLEDTGTPIVGPGLPSDYVAKGLVTDDCLEPPRFA